MRPALRVLPLLLFSLLLITCKKGDDIPGLGSVTYYKGELRCHDCDDFGRKVTIDGNHLFVADYDRVFWLTPSGSGWVAKQVFDFDYTEAENVAEVKVQNNTLCIGLQEYDGTGRVKVYELMAGQWEEIQELRPGLPYDGFGLAIDIDGEHLMIGARLFLYTDSLEGQQQSPSIHFYKKETRNWVPTGFFFGEESFDQGNYSDPIALQGNYAYAITPPWSEGLLQVYHFNGTEWHFKEKWQDSRVKHVKSLSADGDHLMIGGADYDDQPVHIFTMGAGKPTHKYNIDYDFSGSNILSSLAPVQIHEDYAAWNMYRTADDRKTEVILSHLENGVWKTYERYPEVETNLGTFGESFALTDEWLVIGDDYAAGRGKVYLYAR